MDLIEHLSMTEASILLPNSWKKPSRFHSQWDCFIDRINDIILQTLSMYFGSNQKDWDPHLPAVFYAYNGSASENTDDTTFLLTYGR